MTKKWSHNNDNLSKRHHCDLPVKGSNVTVVLLEAYSKLEQYSTLSIHRHTLCSLFSHKFFQIKFDFYVNTIDGTAISPPYHSRIDLHSMYVLTRLKPHLEVLLEFARFLKTVLQQLLSFDHMRSNNEYSLWKTIPSFQIIITFILFP